MWWEEVITFIFVNFKTHECERIGCCLYHETVNDIVHLSSTIIPGYLTRIMQKCWFLILARYFKHTIYLQKLWWYQIRMDNVMQVYDFLQVVLTYTILHPF